MLRFIRGTVGLGLSCASFTVAMENQNLSVVLFVAGVVLIALASTKEVSDDERTTHGHYS